MKFSLMLDLGRTDPQISMQRNLEQVTELVELADRGGFSTVFVGEHHCHEMTVAPNPFTLLAYLSQRTTKIRLGTAVICTPYWHPIRLAGEAGLVDLLSGGRLELGLGRGAYSYEFDRMAGGMTPEEGRRALVEMLPALRGLWAGDYAHHGTRWNFPETTSTPRPVQVGGPPVWLSARHPEVFRLAVENRCNVMVAPLAQPFSEVESLRGRLDDAVAEAANGFEPQMAVLRDTYVGASDEDWRVVTDCHRRGGGFFETLFRNKGGVNQGFVEFTDPVVDLGLEEYTAESTQLNQVFGTVDEVVTKLKMYNEVGTDNFIYNATWGLPFELELQSLTRFISEVLPIAGGSGL